MAIKRRCVTRVAAANTPLVLSLDGEPAVLHADASHVFDLAGDRSVVTDWPSARTPWLARDVDGSGAIEDGRELFGSMTVKRDGKVATQGFEALRELDANGDGRIDASDPAFAELLVWADRDGDRRSSPSELRSLEAAGVVSIDLGYVSCPPATLGGTAMSSKRPSATEMTRGIDVHLAQQRLDHVEL